jgi:hypothetical protein
VGDEQRLVVDLVNEMSKIVQSPFSVKHMKRRLEEALGDNVIICNLNGQKDVVTFNQNAVDILQAFYSKSRIDVNADKIRIVRNASALIKSDIISKLTDVDNDYYPDCSEVRSIDEMLHYLPETLRLFLEEILTGKKELKVLCKLHDRGWRWRRCRLVLRCSSIITMVHDI